MDPLFEDFDRLFDRRIRQLFNPESWGFPTERSIAPSVKGSSNQVAPGSSLSPGFLSTRLDLIESPDAYQIHVELPGVRKEDIHLNIERDVLSIEAERKEKRDENNDTYHYSERRFGRIKRQIALPPTSDPQRVSAKFEDGVLSVSVGKSEEAAKRQSIDIQ